MPTTHRICLFVGDPAGIGPEIIVKALAEDPLLLEDIRLSLVAHLPSMSAAADAADIDLNMLLRKVDLVDWALQHDTIEAGVASEQNGRFMLRGLAVALDKCQKEAIRGLCFAPLNKGAMKKGGMKEADEMRWFANHLGHNGLCGEFNVLKNLWTARVTSHVPLKEVSGLLTVEKITNTIGMLHQSLQAVSSSAPRIAVCGFNPHNGENGLYGDEEGRIIGPAVARSKALGIDASGPYPADTIFVRALRGDFDGIVTMYHDQGQIATKLLGFDHGVTVEGGLPLPITTPGHGTAYDIVGTNAANPSSLLHALALCRKLAYPQHVLETQKCA